MNNCVKTYPRVLCCVAPSYFAPGANLHRIIWWNGKKKKIIFLKVNNFLDLSAAARLLAMSILHMRVLELLLCIINK